MASIRQCPKCGLDLTDTPAALCPICGTRIVASALAAGKWIIALVQVSLSTAFMLIFRFPKFMIVIFGAFILLATALSGLVKPKSLPTSPVPQRPVAHPILFRILSIGVAICSIAVLMSLLFGFVIFMNSYSNWQRYEGESFYRSSFEVSRVYFQRGSKGGVDAYASGTVDGQREWMDLRPYLFGAPHDEAELDTQVPVGTSIPIYLFPAMKGRSRVRVYNAVPPAESYRRQAMQAFQYGLTGLALSGGLLFVLLRLRASCYEKKENAFAATA